VPEDPKTHPISAKSQVRIEILAARRHMPAGVRQKADTLLRAGVADLVGGLDAPVVASYVPLSDEPGGTPAELLATLTSAGAGRILLPVLLADRDLDWAAYDGELTPGHRGTLEPAGAHLGVAAIGTANLVIVPAVAVRTDGVRLGRGGGSYDRALARVHPGTTTVALLYAGEIRADLPVEAHDRAVDAAVTPRGVHWFRR
jgi:5-formyltetrahydrofolate cyclo-ligase